MQSCWYLHGMLTCKSRYRSLVQCTSYGIKIIVPGVQANKCHGKEALESIQANESNYAILQDKHEKR